MPAKILRDGVSHARNVNMSYGCVNIPFLNGFREG